MYVLGFTGLIQLYPLHDNVHLWFVTPLLAVPAFYFLSITSMNRSIILQGVLIATLCLIPVQILEFYNFNTVPRVKLSSYELRGMSADNRFQVNVDRTMRLLNENLKRRDLNDHS